MKSDIDIDCYDWIGCPDGDCDNCDKSPAGEKYIDRAPKLTKWLEDLEKARDNNRYVNDCNVAKTMGILCAVVKEMAYEISNLMGEKP